MYDEIQKIISGGLTPFEYTKIEELKQTYSEEDILQAYKDYGYKPIKYITKVLQNNKKLLPEWWNKEIVNEPLTEEDKKEHEEFLKFIEDFRNEK